MNITIVGGGNIGTQFAVHFAEKQHDVIIYTSQPCLFKSDLKIVDKDGNVIHSGRIICATNDPEIAFRYADYIIVTVPAMAMEGIADIIYEYADISAVIGVIPGTGGSECAFKRCIERGNELFGLERVPSVARLVKKGETVRATGYREELHISALPIKNVSKWCKFIEEIFDMPCKPIPNYLNITLTPSNPVLHTTRLKTLFCDYAPGVTYERIPLFYEEWDDASSKLLLECDEEVQRICGALPEFDLKYVKSLRLHYESSTVKEMTQKITSIDSFKGLETPKIKVGERFVPDLNSRYFTADFSYGLAIIQQIAKFADVEVPVIDDLMMWYRRISHDEMEFDFTNYGITDKKTLADFYDL